MKQYKMNRFLLSLLVLVLTCVSALLVYYFASVEAYEYIFIGILGLLALIGVHVGLMITLFMAFLITLCYGVAVIISGTTDYIDEIGISYIYLVLPTTVAIIAGFIGQFNVHYLRISENFEEDYEALVRIDGLTGFRNKTDYFENLTEEINRKIRYKEELSILLIQLDSFNDMNGLYGDSQGDKFLKYLSEFVVELTRNVDKHYRISNNLFALILPNTGNLGVSILKDRFITEFDSMNIVVKKNNQVMDVDVDIVCEAYNQEGMSAVDFHKMVEDQLAVKPRGEYV